jgi:hypothetical protein
MYVANGTSKMTVSELKNGTSKSAR